MPFDPSTVGGDTTTQFDPLTVAGDQAGGITFDPTSVRGDLGLLDRAKIVGKAAFQLLPSHPEFQPKLPESAVDAAVPYVQRGINAARFGPLGALLPTDPNSSDAGLVKAGGEFVRGMTSPMNLLLLHGLGMVGKAAAMGSTAARVAQLGAAGTFGAQMAQTAGTQAGEAVDVMNDPTKTQAQKSAALAAPVLSGGASVLGFIGLPQEFADLIKGKSPDAAIDTLSRAVAQAPDKETAEAAAAARAQYVDWWVSEHSPTPQMFGNRSPGALAKETCAPGARCEPPPPLPLHKESRL